jgi:DNA-binding FrmR family transcriptional regulator
MPTTKAQFYLDEVVQKDLQARLSRVAGQVKAIQEMLERRESCSDILVQLSAAKSALNQVTIKLLEGHLESCVARCLQEGDERELQELKDALSLVLRRS